MKKKDSSSGIILFFIIAFIFGIAILFLSFKDLDWTFDSVLKILLKDTIQIVVAIFFLCLIPYGIKTSIMKKKFVAKLKNIIDLRNTDSPYSYILQFEYQNRIYPLEITGDHSYIIGNNYVLLTKNLNVLEVLELTIKTVDNKENYWHTTYMPDGSKINRNLLIIFYVFAIIFLIGNIVIVINIIVNKLESQELNNNIIALIVCIPLFLLSSWCIVNDYIKKKKSGK